MKRPPRERRVHRSEDGIAMITVLLVAAALTVMTAAASFVTIREFGASKADRTAAQSLGYAEAGSDRLLLEIRKGNLTWNNISFAGCDAAHPKIQVTGTVAPGGTYVTTLEVYNKQALVPADRFIPTACSSANTGFKGIHTFLITSTGSQPTAKRVVRQIVDIKPLGLPIGIYAYDRIDANGTINMENISMVTEGTVTNRDNIGFTGTDPYYTIGDFYGARVTDPQASLFMPAAVHAKGAIIYGAAGKDTEHRTAFEPNCEANKKGTTGQSLWDGSGTAVLDSISSGCTGANTWPGSTGVPSTNRPPYSRFTEDDRKRVAPTPALTEQDYLTLREAAKQNGLYCTPAGAQLSCTEGGGAPYTVTGSISTTNYDAATVARNFVAYFDFPTNDGVDPYLRKVSWSGGSGDFPCNTDPTLNRSVVIIVRNGSFDSSGGAAINGALLIPEGQFESTGSFTMEGTIIARRFNSKGTITFKLSDCWMRNIPGPFLDATAAGWSEVDR